MWVLFIVLAVFFHVWFTQSYKLNTANAKDMGALTVLLQIAGGICGLMMCPIFEFKLSTDWRVYALLAAACVFYAISDRLGTTVRKGVEASTYAVIQQLSTVFMVLAGLMFFKEPFVCKKIIGAALIIFSNIMVFHKKRTNKIDRYAMLGVVAYMLFSVALFLDVNLCSNFNMAFYTALTLLLPALFLSIGQRIKPAAVIEELKHANKKMVFVTAISWPGFIICQLSAYQEAEATTVAPLMALTVIGNVIAGYIFLGERENLPKKLAAGLIILVGIFLIKG
ncbi:MAG: EamA family transporter [Firmicutes bacterium]|nr:EamA family transporter [Bacillota bacterium]